MRTPTYEEVVQNIEDMRDYDYTTADMYRALFMTTERSGPEISALLGITTAAGRGLAREMIKAAKAKYRDDYGYHMLKEKAENIVYHQDGPVPEWARDGSAGFIMGKHSPESRAELRRMVDSFKVKH